MSGDPDRNASYERSPPAPGAPARHPDEVAPSYVFLATDDSSYMTGQVLHPNGGEIVNGQSEEHHEEQERQRRGRLS